MLDLSGYDPVFRCNVIRDTMVRLPVYEYDPTDDGLECEVITRILARHSKLRHEAWEIEFDIMLKAASLVIFEKSWYHLGGNERTQVIDEVGAKLRMLRI
jgi:hypothetical protein